MSAVPVLGSIMSAVPVLENRRSAVPVLEGIRSPVPVLEGICEDISSLGLDPGSFLIRRLTLRLKEVRRPI